MSLTERMSVEKEKKEEEEEELKGKGRKGEEEKKKEKTGKKMMRIKKTRRRKQRGRWENVQSLNPGPPKFRDHRDEEKAASSTEYKNSGQGVRRKAGRRVLEPKLGKSIREESVFSSPYGVGDSRKMRPEKQSFDLIMQRSL